MSPVLFHPHFKVFQTVPLVSWRQSPSCPNPTHQPSLHIHTGLLLGNLEELFSHKITVAEKNIFPSNV